jgi:predicted GH43/DUF377 family glycosyl hydrolase
LSTHANVPFKLTRIGVIMTPEAGNDLEAEGVLNPASGRTRDGVLYLLPRLVAAGNVSRVGLARVVLADGVPVGVEREGVVLAPDAGWERGAASAGTEDPRVTWIEALSLHVMSYVAYGPMGPRPALAVSENLRDWRRLGPLHFVYQPELDLDLNLCPNKDVVFFPEPLPGPGGVPSFAMLHRPMWDLSWVRDGEGVHLPAGITDERLGIWISYVPVEDVQADINNLVFQHSSALVAMPEHDFEEIKIGAGPPPIRVEEGWLLVHHGVKGSLAKVRKWDYEQEGLSYAAGAMILDAVDPSKVLARTSEPILAPETAAETSGTVPNVVFPTALEAVDGVRYVFYGMADSRIGVARLDRRA